MFILQNVHVCQGKIYVNLFKCLYFFLCSLGQACNHVAALLVFIEYHAHDDDLPAEKSRTSLPVRWNQPPKKLVASDCANNMNSVKPSHGGDPEAESSNHLSQSTFDPHCAEHQVLNKQLLNKLLTQVQKSVPNTELQQDYHNVITML